jgi:hypothetical protein
MNGFDFTPDDENVPVVVNRAGSVGCVTHQTMARETHPAGDFHGKACGYHKLSFDCNSV